MDPNRSTNIFRRYKFLKSKPLSESSSDPIVESVDGGKTDSADKNVYKYCEVSSDEVERGETSKKVWHLKNTSSRSNLEALIASAGCSIQVGEGESMVELRFYLASEMTSTSIFNKDRVKKHLSIWCAVPNGGNGNQLTFAVKVDKLSDSLQFEQALVPEKAIIFNSEKDRKGKLLQSVFLPYLTSQIRNNGQPYNVEYRFENVKNLCFGFTVVQLHCSGVPQPRTSPPVPRWSFQKGSC